VSLSDCATNALVPLSAVILVAAAAPFATFKVYSRLMDKANEVPAKADLTRTALLGVGAIGVGALVLVGAVTKALESATVGTLLGTVVGGFAVGQVGRSREDAKP